MAFAGAARYPTARKHTGRVLGLSARALAAARKSLAQSNKPRRRPHATNQQNHVGSQTGADMSGKVIYQICTMTGLVLALVALRAILS